MDPRLPPAYSPSRVGLGPLPAFALPLAPAALNAWLTRYFARSPRHQRVHRMLLSLLRLHELRAANAIAFDLFLALVPMLALVGWAVNATIAHDSSALWNGSALLGVTPHEFRSFVQGNLQTLGDSTLAPWATLAGWWLSSSAFFSLVAVFEDSFECVPRPYWQTTLLSLGFSLLGFALLVAFGVSSVLFTLDRFSELKQSIDHIFASGWLRAGMGLIAFAGAASYLAFVYRYAIRRHGPRRVWPGALLAASVGSASSIAFGAYASHLSSYSLFYGSLTAVAVALLWLWLWCTTILIGAEVNFTLEDLALLGAPPAPTDPDRATLVVTDETAEPDTPREG